MAEQPRPAFQPFAALRSKYALNWRTHALFAVPAASSGFLNDYIRLGGSPTAWAVTLIVAFFLTVLTIELSVSYRDRIGIKPSIWSSLTILIYAGFVRGVVVYLLGTTLGVVPQDDWAYRLFGAPIYIITTYLIFNALVTSFIEQRDAEQELRAESRNLSHSRDLFSKEIQRLRIERAAKVRDLIAPSIWEISKRLGDAKLKGKADGLVQALRETNEKVVRPLSKQMFVSFDPPTISSMPALGRVGRLVLPKRITLGNSVSVLFLVLVSQVMGYSTQVLKVGAGQAFINILVAGIYFAVISYILKYATARIEHSTFFGLLISIPLGYAVGCSIISINDLPGVNYWAEFPTQAGVFFALTYPSAYLISATSAQRRMVLGQLAQVVEEQKILNSQLRQQVWLDQKLLATELHGSVQAALHAAALSLSKKANPTPADLDRTLESVQGVVERLGDNAYLEGETFKQILTDIADVWDGVCTINYEYLPDLVLAMDSDPKCARSVIEVVRETITNAIKHSKAEVIDVEITQVSGLVRLSIVNVGQLKVAQEYGAGSEIISELTFSHKLSQLGEYVVLEALIPMSLEAAA